MTTRAIETLLSIIASAAPIRRKIEATASIIEYDCPDEIADAAKAFLLEVSEDDELDVEYRLDALRLMRKAEAKKINQPSVTTAEHSANRERWRQFRIGQRRGALDRMGAWPPEPGWADDLRGPDFTPPEGDFLEAWRAALRQRHLDKNS